MIFCKIKIPLHSHMIDIYECIKIQLINAQQMLQNDNKKIELELNKLHNINCNKLKAI